MSPRDSRHRGAGVRDVRHAGAGTPPAAGPDRPASAVLRFPHATYDTAVVGPKWPLTFVGGRVAISRGVQHLRESIAQIIFCTPGEYLLKPLFGSGLPSRVFDQASLLALVHTDVADAVRNWERRVELTGVNTGPIEAGSTFRLGAATSEALASGVVAIDITFRVRGTEEIVNMQLATSER